MAERFDGEAARAPGEAEGMEARRRLAALLEKAPRFAPVPGLESMSRLAAALGRPERRLRVIHLAGTNGKGSTAAMLASILAAAGRRVALFTSPHLVAWEERLRLDGQPVGPGELLQALERVLAADAATAAAGESPLLQSELLTAAAWWLAERRGADWLVQETGLGGRYDPTNAVEAPRAVVWTPVHLDHTRLLGRSIARIAADKAGIAKAGAVAVSARQKPAARAALEAATAVVGGRLRLLGRDFRLGRVRLLDGLAPGDRLGGVAFDYRGPSWRLEELRLPLPGFHQAENAAVAVAVAEALAEQGDGPGPEAVRAGLARVRWPGRLQLWREGGRLWILDGAHNPHAARALAGWLEAAGGVAWTVLAVGREKAAGGLVAALAPAGGRLLPVTALEDGFPLQPAARLARLWRMAGGEAALEPAASPAEAFARLRALASPGERLLVTGSLHLVGAWLRLLRPAGASGPLGLGAAALDDAAQLHVAQP